MKEVIETKRYVTVVNGKNRVTEYKYSGFVDEQGQLVRLTRCVGHIYTEAVQSNLPAKAAA